MSKPNTNKLPNKLPDNRNTNYFSDMSFDTRIQKARIEFIFMSDMGAVGQK
jgi:hypothetical protein